MIKLLILSFLFITNIVFAGCFENDSTFITRIQCLKECAKFNSIEEQKKCVDPWWERDEVAKQIADECTENCESEFSIEKLIEMQEQWQKDEALKNNKEKINKALERRDQEIKNAEQERKMNKAKIRSKCAKTAKDYKNEIAAKDAIEACLQLEGYWE